MNHLVNFKLVLDCLHFFRIGLSFYLLFLLNIKTKFGPRSGWELYLLNAGLYLSYLFSVNPAKDDFRLKSRDLNILLVLEGLFIKEVLRYFLAVATDVDLFWFITYNKEKFDLSLL